MSEIEKMYENAGIEPTYTDECHMADSYYSMAKDLNDRGILFDDYMKQECPNKNEVCYETCPYAYNKEFYPPFTAEKQIELIKWLARKGLLQINYSSHQCYQFNSFRVGGDYKADISEALASHYNTIWQDLTEEEKQQVKGILE